MRYAAVFLALVACGLLVAYVLIDRVAEGTSRRDWVLTGEPADSVLHIEVAIGNGCDFFDRIDVAESEHTVWVTAYSETRNEDNGCDDLLKIEQHEVRLSAPLGDRELRGCDPPGRNFVRDDDAEDCRRVSR